MNSVIAVKPSGGRAVIAAGLRGRQGERGEQGAPFLVDAHGLLASRSQFDGEPEDFSYLATDTGDLYFRTGAPGGWSDPVPFQGPRGDSAYAVAVANGFVGTEAEWLESLQGADGAEGRSITGASINGGGHLILAFSDSTELDAGLVVGADGTDGAPGADGVDGRGITSMAIDGSNHLIITYTDSSTEDAGLIPGAGGSTSWGSIGGTLADQTDLVAALAVKANSADLATVAASGAYADLIGKPSIPADPGDIGAATAAQGDKADTAVQPAVLTAGLAGKVDKEAGKGLSSNDFTSEEKAKLAGLEGSHFKGLHGSLAALQAAHPSAVAGDYADVDAGAGVDVVRYLWDVSDSQWVAQAAAGGSMTPAQVKTAYESNPDTNAFTDAEQAKLGGITPGATANADTDTLAEGATNKYFTEGRVRGTVLTGLSLLTGGVISAADSVLSALGKLQKQISDAVTAIGGKQDTLVSGTNIKTVNGSSLLGSGNIVIAGAVQRIPVACSDETTALAAGTAKVTFRMSAFTLSGVAASLTTAQTSGSIFTVDINVNGASILSTKLTIDNTEKTSATAAVPAVISTTSVSEDAEITIDIDQVGDGTAKGLKVYLIGVPA